MTKSTLQIASEIVEAHPETSRMKSAHKMLLIGMIAEELEKMRKEEYRRGYDCGINSEYYGQNTRHGGT